MWTFASFSTPVSFFLAHLCSLASSYSCMSYTRLWLRNKSVAALNPQTIKSQQCVGALVAVAGSNLVIPALTETEWESDRERAPPPTASSPLRLPHSPPTSSLLILCCILCYCTSAEHLDRGEDREEREKVKTNAWCAGSDWWTDAAESLLVQLRHQQRLHQRPTYRLFVQPGSCDLCALLSSETKMCPSVLKWLRRPSLGKLHRSGCSSSDWILFDLRACQP